jgi:hypothetical protein
MQRQIKLAFEEVEWEKTFLQELFLVNCCKISDCAKPKFLLKKTIQKMKKNQR